MTSDLDTILELLKKGKSTSSIAATIDKQPTYVSFVKTIFNELVANPDILDKIKDLKVPDTRSGWSYRDRPEYRERVFKQLPPKDMPDCEKIDVILELIRARPDIPMNAIAKRVGYSRQWLSVMNKKYDLRNLAFR